jgi:putative pyruvate formate lyase activating enzyme
MESEMARLFSGAQDYPEVAAKALKEMFRQKGSALHLGDNDTAISGIIVRHLVLPGHVENSLKVLRFLAEELSPRIHISLMAQYFPTDRVKHHPELKRGITETEYKKVIDQMERLGMFNGWIQEFESSEFYRPDFDQDHPFE